MSCAIYIMSCVGQGIERSCRLIAGKTLLAFPFDRKRESPVIFGDNGVGRSTGAKSLRVANSWARAAQDFEAQIERELGDEEELCEEVDIF